MHISNLTPDSFSNPENVASPKSQIQTEIARAGTLIKSSLLTIVDVGGQSSAPGARSVTAAEETARIIPLISHLKANRNGSSPPQLGSPFAISVDTYRASVAEAAVAAGVDIINDISAGMLDPDMLSTMARLGKTVVLMHMRGTPETMQTRTSYPDGLIPTIASELLSRVSAAEAAGIRRWRIILDPGIGFAKTLDQNVEILRRLDELRDWPGLRGLPWLVGSSRKRFIGHITGVKRPRDRVGGSLAAAVAAVRGGADIVRVHDTMICAEGVKIADAIWRGRREEEKGAAEGQG